MSRDWYAEIEEMSPKRETRGDVVAFYRKEYPGLSTRGGKTIEQWKRKLSEDIQPFTADKNGKEQSLPNLQRRFQARGNKSWESAKPSAAAAAQYKALGATLPRRPPPGGYVVKAGSILWIQYSDECEKVKIKHDVAVKGPAAQALLDSGDPQIVVNLYQGIPHDGDGPAACDDPDLDIVIGR